MNEQAKQDEQEEAEIIRLLRTAAKAATHALQQADERLVELEMASARQEAQLAMLASFVDAHGQQMFRLMQVVRDLGGDVNTGPGAAPTEH